MVSVEGPEEIVREMVEPLLTMRSGAGSWFTTLPCSTVSSVTHSFT